MTQASQEECNVSRYYDEVNRTKYTTERKRELSALLGSSASSAAITTDTRSTTLSVQYSSGNSDGSGESTAPTFALDFFGPDRLDTITDDMCSYGEPSVGASGSVQDELCLAPTKSLIIDDTVSSSSPKSADTAPPGVCPNGTAASEVTGLPEPIQNANVVSGSKKVGRKNPLNELNSAKAPYPKDNSRLLSHESHKSDSCQQRHNQIHSRKSSASQTGRGTVGESVCHEPCAGATTPPSSYMEMTCSVPLPERGHLEERESALMEPLTSDKTLTFSEDDIEASISTTLLDR